MATVTGFTAARMLEIENTTVVGGLVDVNGRLILSTREGEEIDAGIVKGPAGQIASATATARLPTEEPTVTLGGTPETRTLAFGIPKGLKGDTGDKGDSSLEAGTISLWHGDVAPANWMICDGAAVSRTTYASLFNAIGTKYGAGDGINTFNLPNLKGRVPIGRDAAQTEFDTLGETGGAKQHGHTLSDAGWAQFAMAVSTPAFLMRRLTTGIASWNANIQNTATAGATSTTAVTSATALDGATDVTSGTNGLPPYQVVNFIIKFSTGETQGDSQLATRVGELEAQNSPYDLALQNRMRRAQNVLTGGTPRRVTSSGIGWTQRFIVLGAGWEDPSLAGYWDITMPANGTVIPYYGGPTNPTSSITVANGEIPMVSWSALYYELPLTTSFTSDPSRFRMVGYQTKLPFVPPPTWVLIARRNGDTYGPAVTWGDGQRQDYWRTFNLNGWTDYGGEYEPHGFQTTDTGEIVLRGLVGGGVYSTTVNVASWGADRGPEGRKIFLVASGSGHSRVDVLANGGLIFYQTYNAGSTAWLSLEGVRWHPSL